MMSNVPPCPDIFHASGLPVGYPLILDINLGNRRSRETLKYMEEGYYFDRQATTTFQVCPSLVCVVQ